MQPLIEKPKVHSAVMISLIVPSTIYLITATKKIATYLCRGKTVEKGCAVNLQ